MKILKGVYSNGMCKFLQFIKSNRKMYINLVINDFVTKYNGSAFGAIWGIVNPIITIIIYWFVFTVGLRSGQRSDGIPFILWMICGMVPWFFIAEAIMSMANSFLDYGYLVKKVNFNIILIPLIKLGSALIIHFLFVFVSIVIFNLSGYYISVHYLQLIYYLLMEIFLLIGIGLCISSVVVFFRDLGQIIGIMVQIGFWAIPIVWNTERLDGLLTIIFKLNPFFYIVEGYRECLLTNIAFWDHPYQTPYFWIVASISIVVGMKTFYKLRTSFADVL